MRHKRERQRSAVATHALSRKSRKVRHSRHETLLRERRQESAPFRKDCRKVESLQVLIAEDDSQVSQGLALTLSQAGHAIVGLATDAESALTEAVQKKPDVALLNIQMPNMEPVALIRRIMEECPTPIIALTTDANAQLAAELADAGAAGYLVKPISPSDLFPALAIAIARFRHTIAIQSELNQLKDTLETRKYAEQAKGIIMQRLQLPEGQAYAHLREKCRNQQKTMKQASLEIIEAERYFLEQLAKDPPSKMRYRSEDRYHSERA